MPQKVRCFINSVRAAPFECIEEPLKKFVWEFDEGDFHHWIDLFSHFDSYFEKYIKSRKDLQVEDDFLEFNPPFPKGAILQILRVIKLILENCTNRHFYSSYKHLASLLASTDAEVVEACLQTLAAFMKKTTGKYSGRDSLLNSKLFAFAQGWGGKEEGFGLVSCVAPDISDPVAYELGCTLHFEFYAANKQSHEHVDKGQLSQGLQIIHLPKVNVCSETDTELLNKLVKEYSVPPNLRFSLLTRIRYARAFGCLASRQKFTCIRLYAFIVLVQAGCDSDELVSFFNNEPEFINELVSLLSSEDAVPEKIRVLCVLSLVALWQDRSRQPAVLTTVTSGGHRGILSSIMQKVIDAVVSNASKWSVVFAEALLSFVTVLVSSSSGCSAMREAGFIPTLLPLLKDTDPQHLHLVSTSVHVLEAFMDYSNPAAALVRDLGGLDDAISRLKVEVSCVDRCSIQHGKDPEPNRESTQLVKAPSAEMDDSEPLYSEALVGYHRRLLMEALLRAISLGAYAPGSTSRVYGSEESLLPSCLSIIFRRAKDFGGGVFSLAATVMCDLLHKDPTCFQVLEASGLPSSFIDAIMDGVFCSSEAITCIPQCLDALCLNSNGLQVVKDRNALRCFVKIFTSRSYLRALVNDTPGSLSRGLDELMRHASALRGPGVDMLIEILNVVAKMGSGAEASFSSCANSNPVPMDTDSEDKNVSPADDLELRNMGSSESNSECLINTGCFLPEFVSNAARLLETILQNADTCRIFVEKKGIESVLQLFKLPQMPSSASIGHNISVAFKNFSPQHFPSLVRATFTFLREHIKLTNELLTSIEGAKLEEVEIDKQKQVLRCISCLEVTLCLLNFLLKGTTSIISELGTAEADIMKDLGRAYRVVLWQLSLCCDSRVEEKMNVEVEVHNTDNGFNNVTGRESEDDANTSMIRYMNPVSIRNTSHWGGDRDFLSVVRSGEGLHRRSRHGLARIRGGRVGRHLDALNIDPEVFVNLPDTFSRKIKGKSPDVMIFENLNKLAATIRSFFSALVKGFTSNRRRTESASLTTASKSVGAALAKILYDSLIFTGHCVAPGHDVPPSMKCRYLGKVVDDIALLTFDSRRRICFTSMINYLYVHGTFKELLTTFEATSQLLWTVLSVSTEGTDDLMSGKEKASHSFWLLDTMQIYCRSLENFVNSAALLSPISASHSQLLVQPVAVGLSIGLFPVPREPENFVRMLQSQVLDVLLPVWNHPQFPSCSPVLIKSILSLATHIFSGVGDAKQNRSTILGSANLHPIAPPPDEATIATIVEMGFTRARAEEALRRVETNNVEMAVEWLFSHAEDPVQDNDELAQALALSLGSSAETSKSDTGEKSKDTLTEEGLTKTPPVDDVLAALLRLFQGNDSVAFPLTDFIVTLCNRNNGEDRRRVISYLIQKVKLLSLEISDINGFCMITHVLALLLSEDSNGREVAAQNGIISVALDILTDFKFRNVAESDAGDQKCISSLLLILVKLLQSRPTISLESRLRGSADRVPDSAIQSVSHDPPSLALAEVAFDIDNEYSGFEKILGKSTGYLTMEESHRAMEIACDLLKQHVPSIIMQALLQLCAHLTKKHVLALKFLESGGMSAIFSLPRGCFFPGYDTVASSIVRHLLEDPQTLQIAMELEIRQTLNGSRHSGRATPRIFLTSMAPVISRDPLVFMKAVTSVCQLETTGGRSLIVLQKEKEKDKSKGLGDDGGFSSNEGIKIHENKSQDCPGKCSKGTKKIPVNLALVIDKLLEIVIKCPSIHKTEVCSDYRTDMEVDVPASKLKGKGKVDETRKIDTDSFSERSAEIAKVAFVLKLLGDILSMYVHAVGVILKRDMELCQVRDSSLADSPMHGGIIYHILHRILPLTMDKAMGPDEWRDKLYEKASLFLVVLCGRSGEGRRRVINGLVKALSSFMISESDSATKFLLPDKKVFSFIGLVYSILSKNSSYSCASGCSPDIVKTMIESGIVKCLSRVLEVIDLDHPDAPKTVNLILKALEGITRVANAREQVSKIDGVTRKKSMSSSGRTDDQITAPSSQTGEDNPNRNSQQRIESQGALQMEGGSHDANLNLSSEQEDMRTEVEETHPVNPSMELGMDFMHEEIEDGSVLHGADQSQMTFHVESRENHDSGDEDDDMGDDGDDDEDDDEGEEEDENIAEDGAGLMSLADTDVEEHDDTGIADEYNDEMVDVEDDDFHENRVIEVRWREALDGLDHLQVLGQPGSTGGLIDVTAEPFEGVNVDDLFAHGQSVSYERRRQSSQASFERSTTEVNGFQHPLLLRPLPQTAEITAIGPSGGNSSRSSESLSVGNFNMSQFYMFDSSVLPYDHVPSSFLSDRLGGPLAPPLTDYSVGMDSMHLSGRGGQGEGRWSDDGQPQAAAIAQVLEAEFISQLHRIVSSSCLAEAQSQSENAGLLRAEQSDPSILNDNQPVVDRNDSGRLQSGGQSPENSRQISADDPNQVFESVSFQGLVDPQSAADGAVGSPQEHEPMSIQPLCVNTIHNEQDIMETGEGHTNETLGTASGLIVPSTNYRADLRQGSVSPVLGEHNSLLIQPEGSSSRIVRPSDFNVNPNLQTPNQGGNHELLIHASDDVIMSGAEAMEDQREQSMVEQDMISADLLLRQNNRVAVDQSEQDINSASPNASSIDPTFLEALPEDLRAEVLASQQAQHAQLPTFVPPLVEDIDPEFLAALPPDIQEEVLAQQRAQRIVQQAEGQPVDMNNASIIPTFPADHEEVLLSSSDQVLQALPSSLLAEAQVFRDRAMSHFQARSIFGSSHMLNNRRNGLGFDRQTAIDRGVGATVGRKEISAISDGWKVKEIEGEPLFDVVALKALIRLLRIAQPLGKGLLQRLLLNLCAHSVTRATLLQLLLDMVRPEAEGFHYGLVEANSQRLYGCLPNVVYGRSQLLYGLPPLVVRRILEILIYLSTNHSGVADILFSFDSALAMEPSMSNCSETIKDKGKEKILGKNSSVFSEDSLKGDVPFILLLKLLNQPLFLRSITHLEQVMGLIQVVLSNALSKVRLSQFERATSIPQNAPADEFLMNKGSLVSESEPKHEDGIPSVEKRSIDIYHILKQLPQSDLHNLCNLLGYEGLSDKVYMLTSEVMKKLASDAFPHKKFFALELSNIVHSLSDSAVKDLAALKNSQMPGLGTVSTAGSAILRVLQALNSLISPTVVGEKDLGTCNEQERTILWKLNVALKPLWQELSNCISLAETHPGKGSLSSVLSNIDMHEHVEVASSLSSSLPPGSQRILPFIEAFFILCEKLQANQSVLLLDHVDTMAGEIKESAHSSTSSLKGSGESHRKIDGSVTFTWFADKHRRLLNAFIRHNPALLEKSLSMMLEVPRLIDFDNKRAYFRSRIRQQHEHHLSRPVRVNVRRAYILEDSYNQLRKRPTHDLKGRLNVQFQGEEGIDAGGLTREWYQLLSRVIFDKGALLFTTVGNNTTFQPNPNSVYQTEHLSYFKFVGRVVAKALFDGQLLDVYFTRSFYKHILGVKVTYHDIEAVDPDYYKNLKWMLENDVSDIPDLTFSMDADEEKHILYGKAEATDYELKPGGRNIRVTEETKQEYVDLVAGHILTNSIRPQINSFLEGFGELVLQDLISIFNDKELELLISGLPEIDLDDLKANTEFTGYTAASAVVQWFWEVVETFNKEDMARLLQFVTGTSKVPLEGFKMLQGISGPQRFQIHKAYGAPERLPTAHTCFNQLDLPEYSSKEQLQERLLLAIHEASEGFGFG